MTVESGQWVTTEEGDRVPVTVVLTSYSVAAAHAYDRAEKSAYVEMATGESGSSRRRSLGTWLATFSPARIRRR